MIHISQLHALVILLAFGVFCFLVGYDIADCRSRKKIRMLASKLARLKVLLNANYGRIGG